MNREKFFNPENNTDKMEQQFREFVEAKNLTSQKIKEAYVIFVSKENSEDDVIKEVVEEMERLSQSGFPINRFAEIMNDKFEEENVLPSCIRLIDSLNMDDRSKRTLKSIAENFRTGDISLYIGEEEVGAGKIKRNNDQKKFLKDFAGILLNLEVIGKKFGDKEMGIMFAEN